MEVKLKNLQATKDFAKGLVAVIASRHCEEPKATWQSPQHVIASEAKQSPDAGWILLLDGKMGSGKTTFIRELGAALGIKENITSPTFVGMHEYHIDGLGFYHFDLYQVSPGIEDLAELVGSGLPKILVFEWAERLSPEQKKILESLNNMQIKITVLDNEERIFETNIPSIQ